jgi:hypothetical protein
LKKEHVALASTIGTGLTFGHEGNLYVSDEVNGNVLRFNGHTGALIGTFASGPELNFFSLPA